MVELQLLSDDDLKELRIPMGPRRKIQAALVRRHTRHLCHLQHAALHSPLRAVHDKRAGGAVATGGFEHAVALRDTRDAAALQLRRKRTLYR